MGAATEQIALLTARLKEDDQAAFNALFEAMGRKLLAKAYHKVKSREVAEELVHDVFVKLWEKRKSLLIHTSLEGYLFVMLRNEVLQYFRSQPVDDKLVCTIEAADILEDSTLEKELQAIELRQILDHKIEHLPEKCQQIFRLSREQHYSIEEIAQQLNLSPQTVKNQLTKALKTLRYSVGEFISLFIFLWNTMV